MNQESLIAVLIFMAGNAGSLVYFAGSVRAILKEHDRRLSEIEVVARDAGKQVAFLTGKEERT